MLTDRLSDLLNEHDVLYGVICRDATLTDIELMAQEGYNIVWLDLEHGPQSVEDAIRLGRMITHLGMVPLARITELTRTNIQRLLDGGMQVLTLPDVRAASEAAEFVQLGKFPPLGQRGVGSTTASTGFALTDAEQTLRKANNATRLMVMFESDQGYEALDEVLGIEGIDAVTIGPMDWSVSLGEFGAEAVANLAPKVDRVLTAASEAGKITVMAVSSVEQARHYQTLGVRVLFVGVDIALKRKALAQAIGQFKDAVRPR